MPLYHLAFTALLLLTLTFTSGCDASTDLDDETQIDPSALNGLWEFPGEGGTWYFDIDYPDLRVYEFNSDDGCWWDDGEYTLETLDNNRFSVLGSGGGAPELILEWVEGPTNVEDAYLNFIDPETGEEGSTAQLSDRSPSQLTICP